MSACLLITTNKLPLNKQKAISLSTMAQFLQTRKENDLFLYTLTSLEISVYILEARENSFKKEKKLTLAQYNMDKGVSF